MKLAGKITLGVAAAVLVLILVAQAAAPDVAAVLAWPLLLLVLVGAGLWVAGRVTERRARTF